MSEYQHQELASGRWATMSFMEQMANVGSEVERAISWRKKNNGEYGRMAIERALELLELTRPTGARSPIPFVVFVAFGAGVTWGANIIKL
jgi:hypothetical protein